MKWFAGVSVLLLVALVFDLGLLAYAVYALVGIGALYLAGVLQVAGNKPLVPAADPRLEESLAFENA